MHTNFATPITTMASVLYTHTYQTDTQKTPHIHIVQDYTHIIITPIVILSCVHVLSHRKAGNRTECMSQHTTYCRYIHVLATCMMSHPWHSPLLCQGSHSQPSPWQQQKNTCPRETHLLLTLNRVVLDPLNLSVKQCV